MFFKVADSGFVSFLGELLSGSCQGNTDRTAAQPSHIRLVIFSSMSFILDVQHFAIHIICASWFEHLQAV